MSSTWMYSILHYMTLYHTTITSCRLTSYQIMWHHISYSSCSRNSGCLYSTCTMTYFLISHRTHSHMLMYIYSEEMLTLGDVCQGNGRHMFGSYDKLTHRHQAPQLLLFTFPPGTVQAEVEAKDGTSSTSPDTASPVSPLHAIEQRAFKALEVIYLEIYFLIKASLARTRKQRVLYDRGSDREGREGNSTGESSLVDWHVFPRPYHSLPFLYLFSLTCLHGDFQRYFLAFFFPSFLPCFPQLLMSYYDRHTATRIPSLPSHYIIRIFFVPFLITPLSSYRQISSANTLNSPKNWFL